MDAGTVGTTQFDLTPELQQLLIDNGRQAAKTFLGRFDLADSESTYHRRFGAAG